MARNNLIAVNDLVFAKEYWAGDSRDGHMINGDGWHYYQMDSSGRILEAFEFYETDDGTEVVSPLPEMKDVSWTADLGFEDLEALDIIKRIEFERIKALWGRKI